MICEWRFVRLAVAGLLLAASYSPAFAEQCSDDIKSGLLDNGFTYWIERHHPENKRVAINFLVKVGSDNEATDEIEYAHLLEHALLYSPVDASDRRTVQQRFAALGAAEYNAGTGPTSTAYSMTVSSEIEGAVDGGLYMARGWAERTSIDQADLQRHASAVAEEFRHRGGLVVWNTDLANSMLYKGTNYGPQSIRQIASARAATSDRLLAFHKKWYRPDLQGLAVVGDLNPCAVEEKIKAAFGAIPKPQVAPPSQPSPVPLSGLQQYVSRLNPFSDQAQLTIMMKRRTQPETLRTSIVGDLVSQMLQARFRRSTEVYGPTWRTSVVANSRQYGEMTMLFADVTAAPEHIGVASRSVLGLLFNAQLRGFAAAELVAARNVLMDRLHRENRPLTASDVATAFAGRFASGAPFDRRVMDSERREMLEEITLHELDAAARSWITERDFDVLMRMPDKPGLTPVPEVTLRKWATAARIAAKRAYVPAEPDQAIVPHFAANPTPVPPISVTEQEGVTVARFPNGATVLIIPVPDMPRVELVALGRVGRRVGTGAGISTAATIGAVAYGGVAGLDIFQLERFQRARDIAVSLQASRGNVWVRGDVGNAADVSTMLRLAHNWMTAPNRNSRAIADYQAEAERQMQAASASAEQRFDTAVTSFDDRVAAGDIDPDVTVVRATTADQFHAAYARIFGDLGGFVFVLRGNVTRALLADVERYIGSLPGAGERTKDGPKSFTMPPPQYYVQRDGPAGMAKVRLVYFAAVARGEGIGEAALLSPVVQARLMDRLREQERGVYDVTAQLTVFADLARAAIMIDFTCAPENVDRLIAAARAELVKLKDDGLSQRELGPSVLRPIDRGLPQNVNLIALRWMAHESLTVPAAALPDSASIKRLLTALLQPEHLSQFILLPASAQP